MNLVYLVWVLVKPSQFDGSFEVKPFLSTVSKKLGNFFKQKPYINRITTNKTLGISLSQFPNKQSVGSLRLKPICQFDDYGKRDV